MIALAPPSSSDTRLRSRPASSPIRLPTSVDPVNAIIRTSGCPVSARPTSAPPPTIRSTPSGKPARSNSAASTCPPDTWVCGSGLSTTALPRASAGATARIPSSSGTFHGLITPTTPSGARRPRLCLPSGSVSSSPCGWVGRAEATHSSSSTSPISPAALARRVPDSRTSHSTTSSVCSSSTRAARRSTAARSAGGVAAQAGWAAVASAIEARTPSASERTTRPSTSPVAGSTTSRVFGPDAAGVTRRVIRLLLGDVR